MNCIQLLALGLEAISAVLAQTAYYSPQPTPMPCFGDACVDSTYDDLRYQDNTIIRRPGMNGASDLYFQFSNGDHPGRQYSNQGVSSALIAQRRWRQCCNGTHLEWIMVGSIYLSTVNRWLTNYNPQAFELHDPRSAQRHRQVRLRERQIQD